MDGGTAAPATPRRRPRWSPASDASTASVYGDPAAVAQADAVVAAVTTLIGTCVTINRVAPFASVAAVIFAVVSATALVATRLPSYARCRTAITVAHRLVVAVAGQIVITDVYRYPLTLPQPTTARAWVAWFLGRSSPHVAALLAASARQPTVGRAVALGIASTAAYALLQPPACRAILVVHRGADAYFVLAARAVSAVAARVAAVVGAPSVVPAARSAAAPCPLPACVAVMTMLHAVACVVPAQREEGRVSMVVGWSRVSANHRGHASCLQQRTHTRRPKVCAALAGPPVVTPQPRHRGRGA